MTWWEGLKKDWKEDWEENERWWGLLNAIPFAVLLLFNAIMLVAMVFG